MPQYGEQNADLLNLLPQHEMLKGTIHQSRPLPPWLWYIIAKLVGVKTKPSEWPIFGYLLLILTVSSGLIYLISTGVFYYFDVNNNDIPDNYCEKINLPPMLCHFRYVSQIIFAFLAFLWNFLIALICFSACRTHTIAIRTFLLELDEDAMVNLLKESKVSTRPIRPKSHSFSESLLPSETSPSETSPLLAGVGNRRSGVLRTRSQSELRSVVRDVLDGRSLLDTDPQLVMNGRTLNTREEQVPFLVFIHNKSSSFLLDSQSGCLQTDDAFDRGTVATDWPNLSTATGLTSYSHAPSNRMLTNKEILQRYWKLQCRLMTTSLALQRWMACWILLILSWSLVYLLYWISHEASIIDMLKFCLPLFLLPLVCSGVTEVNSEGQRVSRSICPLEERLPIINLLLKQPLSFTLYGYALDYSSLVTAIAAVAVAFATKIILASVNG
ncbi:hypothetical protein BSL78_21542 [Apostichopus japonicus]|uniref:Uncharacterized protein n=1 Tax=Stichopus japonicus TaxID=307972 RepID=A0A2G8K0S5_STIJA|nr:hypothetical protein BSL78_21542 [Apostichopus japonicus]